MNTTLQALYSDLEKARNENSDDTIKKTLEFIQTLITERYLEQEKQMIVDCWIAAEKQNDSLEYALQYYEDKFGSKRFKIGGIE